MDRSLLIVLLLSCLVEPFKDDVSELFLHEGHVDVFQDATRFGLDYADVVDSSRADPDDFSVHERFNQLRGVANCLDPVVIC